MAHDVDLTALELLVSAVDMGSLSAAARSHGIAQPNASRTIAKLERQLGLSLLNRSTRGSVPTAEGAVVVQWAREVLKAADTFCHNVASLSDQVPTQFTIAASQTIAEHLLPLWLTALRRTRSTVQVHVQVMNSRAVISAVEVGDVDLGFVEGPLPRGAVVSSVISPDELILVVAPSHPWAKRTEPVSAQELRDVGLVTREAGSGTRRILDDALGTPITAGLELGSNRAIETAVMSGAGPAVPSRIAVAEALAHGELVEVPLTGVDVRRAFRAVWTGPSRLTGTARDLVDIARRTTIYR